jgi:hypothetical protein
MGIVEALKQEESKLQRQLAAVKTAIAALKGGNTGTVTPRHTSGSNGASAKRTMSAAVRAKIARSARERWARIRAEKAKKAK